MCPVEGSKNRTMRTTTHRWPRLLEPEFAKDLDTTARTIVAHGCTLHAHHPVATRQQENVAWFGVAVPTRPRLLATVHRLQIDVRPPPCHARLGSCVCKTHAAAIYEPNVDWFTWARREETFEEGYDSRGYSLTSVGDGHKAKHDAVEGSDENAQHVVVGHIHNRGEGFQANLAKIPRRSAAQ